jgi:NADP-dependent 3-hydroxy acid dehydrogenase YdfG
VVHGVHLVLAALDSIKLVWPFTVMRLDAQFRLAVMLGEAVSFTHKTQADGSLRIFVAVGSQVRITVEVEVERVPSIGLVAYRDEWPSDVSVLPSIDELSGVAGSDMLGIDEAAFAALFPSLATSLSRTDAGALLATTRVVGMQCPGHWALFRRLIWQRAGGVDESGPPSEVISYRVSGVDKRFAMLTLALDAGCLAIRAEVIVREAPPMQIDLSVACSRVRFNEFKNTRALIVGGSRGLGELTAKLLAAGGAEVLITYRTGAEDAARVAADLGNSARTVQFAVDAPDQAALKQILSFAPTHLSYFATPVIAKRPPKSWDAATFDRFISVYVTGLSNLLAAIHGADSLKSLFFPSSTFIDAAPVGFAEYIAAKIAGETLCKSWQQIYPNQRIVVERLPPLVTDQTSAHLGMNTMGNLDALLPIIRRTIP